MSADGEDMRIGEIEIRPGEYQVLIDGARVGLTVREFQIFYCLVQRPDRVLTRAEIYGAVWGGPMTYRDRSVDVFVRKVRRKLARAAPQRMYIHTHFGVGYRFTPAAAAGPATSADAAQAADAVTPIASAEQAKPVA